MPRSVSKPSPSKFARYRERKRAAGKKLLRLWVLDPNAPGFQKEIDRQVALMNASADEEEVTKWIEAVMANPDAARGLESSIPPP